MRYDHPLYDVMMQLFTFAEKQLEEHGKGIMLSEIRGLHETAVNEFALHRDRVAEALKYISFEDCVNPLPGLDRLNDAEIEATQGDIKATSTKEGQRAVKAAQERLDERARLQPVAVAKEELEQKEDARRDKESVVREAKAERDRPAVELREAKKAEEAAKAAVRKAEEDVKKAAKDKQAEDEEKKP